MLMPMRAMPLSACAAALFMLPESPRWLVVNGRLDEALAVIHAVYTSKVLPSGGSHLQQGAASHQHHNSH